MPTVRIQLVALLCLFATLLCLSATADAAVRTGTSDVRSAVGGGVYIDSFSDEECDYTAVYVRDLYSGEWFLFAFEAACVELTIDGFEEVEDAE